MDAALIDDPRIQDLYAQPREDFVTARTALAKEVAEEDKEAAREIRKLRKPSMAAWAVNRVARAQPEMVTDLIEAGDAVRQAQERALDGDRSQLRDRVDRRRELVRQLTDEAISLAGHSHRDEIDATFEAASIDVEVGELIQRGVLTSAVARPSGFGVLSGMEFGASPATSGSSDDGADSAQADAAERERLEHRLREAEEAVEASQARLAEAEGALADAAREVEVAREAATHAVEARDAARAELTEGDDRRRRP